MLPCRRPPRAPTSNSRSKMERSFARFDSHLRGDNQAASFEGGRQSCRGYWLAYLPARLSVSPGLRGSASRRTAEAHASRSGDHHHQPINPYGNAQMHSKLQANTKIVRMVLPTREGLSVAV